MSETPEWNRPPHRTFLHCVERDTRNFNTSPSSNAASLFNRGLNIGRLQSRVHRNHGRTWRRGAHAQLPGFWDDQRWSPRSDAQVGTAGGAHMLHLCLWQSTSHRMMHTPTCDCCDGTSEAAFRWSFCRVKFLKCMQRSNLIKELESSRRLNCACCNHLGSVLREHARSTQV
eukprot:366028-Chlamydomonas_euryale.AAC.16